jgi:hypothetical protein
MEAFIPLSTLLSAAQLPKRSIQYVAYHAAEIERMSAIAVC